MRTSHRSGEYLSPFKVADSALLPRLSHSRRAARRSRRAGHRTVLTLTDRRGDFISSLTGEVLTGEVLTHGDTKAVLIRVGLARWPRAQAVRPLERGVEQQNRRLLVSTVVWVGRLPAWRNRNCLSIERQKRQN